ncbi:hypothetical protein EWM62_00300 [Mucilaginibacter terrigena]|uniref:Uncharacterized protein n=1 Tax=Mucilaginibacter terrigena TaxID=2492395 RepID=A0A4Q5LR68_9SPHI|nr:hypothetical protein [Mucilaginibacter terrigena]RYU91917.1 hypothetical protein EWM62_00300 [Mucilaginibacter terrigena]
MKALRKTGLILSLCLMLMHAAGCKKDNKTNNGPVDAGNVPHTEVPEPFVGEFAWSQVSSGGYSDQYGGYYSNLVVGAHMRLDKKGTGIFIYRYDIRYSNGGSKSVHIDSDVAYEIQKLNSERMTIIIHFIRGKNYEDGVFLHDLDAAKIYPNGDYVWENVPYGTNAQGKIYFQPGPELTFTKK